MLGKRFLDKSCVEEDWTDRDQGIQYLIWVDILFPAISEGKTKGVHPSDGFKNLEVSGGTWS